MTAHALSFPALTNSTNNALGWHERLESARLMNRTMAERDQFRRFLRRRAMTQAELESELATLRSRLTRLEDEWSVSRSRCDKIASQSKWLGLLFAVTAIAFGFAQIALSGHLPSPLSMPFLLTAIVLGLLAQLRTPAGWPR
jgi:hypothetical protein